MAATSPPKVKYLEHFTMTAVCTSLYELCSINKNQRALACVVLTRAGLQPVSRRSSYSVVTDFCF